MSKNIKTFEKHPLMWGMICGTVISILLGACITVVGAKAGITPAVSPLVVLIGWMTFFWMFPGKMSQFLGALQVTGSGGTAIAGAVVFAAPIVQVMTAELTGTPVDVNIGQLIVACLAGSLLGWGFIGLSTPRLLSDPRLPAPEAVACDRLIQTAAANPEARPNIFVSLIPGLLMGGFTTAFDHFKIISKKVASFSIMGAQFPISASPIYIGIGALVTFETAMMMFIGGTMNAGIKSYSASNGLPSETFRWVGGAAMFVCVIYSLINYILEEKKKKGKAVENINTALLEILPAQKRLAQIGIAVGAVLFVILLASLGIGLFPLIGLSVAGIVLGYLLSNLGGLLSLQVGSAASPVSGTVFVGLLVFSVVGIVTGLSGAAGAMALVPPAVAILASIVASNDASQDYKTVYLNGYRVSDSYLCQLVGLLSASFIVPFVLSMIHQTQTLGSEALPIPQANFFGLVLKSIFVEAQIPVGAVGFGLVVGVLCVIMEITARKKGILLSSMALAVGIYLPVAIGMGALFGNLAKTLGARSLKADSHQGILVTAGFICGDALFGLIISFLLLAGMNTGFEFETLPGAASTILFLVILFGIGWNYSQKNKLK